jgi:hypothetical protein
VDFEEGQYHREHPRMTVSLLQPDYFLTGWQPRGVSRLPLVHMADHYPAPSVSCVSFFSVRRLMFFLRQ